MTDEQLQEMRSRIAELEDEFSRRANILLSREHPDSRSDDNATQWQGRLGGWAVTETPGVYKIPSLPQMSKVKDD